VIPKSLLVLAACWWALPAAALLTRADRDDAEYLELASRYTSAIPLGARAGEGVLVSARWILTAAHRGQALRDAKTARLRIGAAGHEIQAVHIHPDWKGGGANDIALIQIKTDVRGIAPTPVYRGADENGKTVVIAGHGGGKKRASINTVDRLEARSLALRIKPPDEASDLQGEATAEETGGPAFIQVDDELFVAGVLHGTAGGWDTHARVSAYASWVEATMLEVARAEAEALLGAR
jgi:hypothetical protein